jgi:hypothetical protein
MAFSTFMGNGFQFSKMLFSQFGLDIVSDIFVYQYNETNVMHFLFNLFRIKGPLHVSSITHSSLGGAAHTAFGILHAYITSVDCDMVAVQPHHSQLTLYTHAIYQMLYVQLLPRMSK